MSVGSIPACAGEPCAALGGNLSGKVYPRVCGGTPSSPFFKLCLKGLSPRVRGNPVRNLLRTGPQRSIPACAGEPTLQGLAWLLGRVYPRVCGGTIPGATMPEYEVGLSPRVRGNRYICRVGYLKGGSIPACAGEPSLCVCHVYVIPVYPRVCGGTTASADISHLLYGLSPRVRGNQPRLPSARSYKGSIPACEGEPCLLPYAAD